MDKIYFKVSGQSLMKTGGLSTYASDTVEYIQAEFTLSDEWKEYDSVRAIWQNGDIVAPPSVLDSEGKCLVPFEVLTERGRVTVNLVGSSANGIILAKRITSYIVTAFMVTVKVNIDGSDPQTITPSQFEQFVEAVKDNADRAEAGAGEAKDEADRAESEAESALASAQAAESSATRASNYVADARGYAKSASDSADASASSATASANSASASAGSAADSANSASASATSAREAEEAKQTILTMRAVARSLPEGSQATASYENGVLTLGIPKGDKGDTGNGIDHVVLNEDYTLTVYFTDGTSVTTESIRGEKGETGAVPDFAIGEVTTLDPDEEASAEITGTAENPILNLGIPQGKTGEVSYEDLSSLLPLDTASGDIISIPDGQPVIPVQSLKVQLDPIQDLHGYDKPWSAGAGKNKYNPANYIVGTTSHYNKSVGEVLSQGGGASRATSTGENPIIVDVKTDWAGVTYISDTIKSGQEYCLSFSPTATTSANCRMSIYYINDNYEVLYRHANYTTPQNILTLLTPTEDCRVAVFVGSTTAQAVTVNNLQLELGSSATAYAPYENICPISGHTECVTGDDPVYGGTIEWNQLVPSDAPSSSVVTNNGDGSFTAIAGANEYYIIGRFNVEQGHKYLASCRGGDATSCYLRVDGADGNPWIREASSAHIYTAGFSGEQKPIYIRTFQPSQNITVVPQLSDLTQMFGAGNEPTTVDEFKALFPLDYYAYNAGETTCVSAVNGNAYSIYTTTLGRTVYGGTLDVVSGELVVDRAMVTLNTANMDNSEEFPGWRSSGIRSLMGSGLNNVFNDAQTNVGRGIGVNTIGTNDVLMLLTGQYGLTQSEWKSLSVDVQMIIPLATPQTYQLDPQTISLLHGNNNVWSDGEVEMVYNADVQLWVEKKLT